MIQPSQSSRYPGAPGCAVADGLRSEPAILAPSADVPAWHDLLDELRRRFDMVDEVVAAAGLRLAMYRPRSVDDLICEEDFNRDERLPYWAQVWPSAIALAGLVVKEEGRGRRLLELGCGLGLVSFAAVTAGFDVLAIDYYQPALDFLRVNAARNRLRAPAVRLVDWRRFPDDLTGFDMVVAADVLYERPNCPLVAEAFRRSLAPDGLGLVADPGRLAAVDFFDECERRGLSIELADRVLNSEAPKPHDIELYEIQHAG